MSDILIDEIKSVGKKIDEQKSAFDTKFASVEQVAAEMNTKLEQKIQDEVKAINEEMSKKGATLEEIQKEIRDFKAKTGRFKGGETGLEKKAVDLIAEAFAEHHEQIKGARKGNSVKLEMKAAGTMTAAANLTGNTVATYDLTPAVRGRRRINIRDLLPVINSSTGTWKFYRQNTPVGEGSFGTQSSHGTTKNQLDYDLTEVTVNAEYLAGFALIAKQMMQDLPFLQSYVANELVEDYKRSESQKFFSALAAAAVGDASNDGGTVLAEHYIDWIANLEANDYYANAIVTTARNKAKILKTKPNDYSVPGGIQIAPDGTIMFMGIPLIAQNNIAANMTLIGDFTRAALIQAEGLSVEFFEQDGTNVRQNIITARAECRVDLAILRPDAFIYA